MHSFSFDYKNDYYALAAKKKGLRARSYFKLEQIDQKFRIFQRNQKILDLGAFPGSWIQYVLEKTKKNTLIVGVDLQKIKSFKEKQVILLQKDIFNLNKKNFSFGLFNTIISDLAPKTTGNKDVDSSLSFQLVEKSFLIAKEFLVSNGFFIVKYLEGEDKKKILKMLNSFFSFVKAYRPKATRRKSREIFLIGKK